MQPSRRKRPEIPLSMTSRRILVGRIAKGRKSDRVVRDRAYTIVATSDAGCCIRSPASVG